MKKLMCAVAAVAAGFAFAEGEAPVVQSANVVGYNNNTLRTGALGAGATFLPITGKKINIQDIAVTCSDPVEGEYGIGECYIQVLNAGGCSSEEETYLWFDVSGDFGDGEVTYKGWYYLNPDTGLPMELPEPVEFFPGDGLWITAPNATYKLVSSGQVSNEDIPTVLRTGAKMVVNATSATVNLNGGTKGEWKGVYVTCTDPVEGEYGIGECYVQVLNAGGCSNEEETYLWFDVSGDFGDGEVTFYGWYYLNPDTGLPMELGKDVPVAAGEALWVTAPNNTYSITFPSAL